MRQVTWLEVQQLDWFRVSWAEVWLQRTKLTMSSDVQQMDCLCHITQLHTDHPGV
jgi:hypothetical protein